MDAAGFGVQFQGLVQLGSDEGRGARRVVESGEGQMEDGPVPGALEAGVEALANLGDFVG